MKKVRKMTDIAGMRANAGCVCPVGRLEIRLCEPDFSLHFPHFFHEGLLISQRRIPKSPSPTSQRAALLKAAGAGGSKGEYLGRGERGALLEGRLVNYVCGGVY